MTKEQAIKHLKLMQSGARNAIRYKKNDKEISEEERKEDIEIYQDQLEALEIATKVLEQQSSNDCVSRQAVLDMAKSYNTDGYDSYTPLVVDVEDIEELPSVTPTQSWIPVSEELPKENGWYQCTVILNDLPRTMELFYKNGKWLDNRRINMFDTYDIYGYDNTKEKHKLSYQELISEFEWNQVVIAWQPLPQPYEEKRGNENGSDKRYGNTK